MFTPSSCPYTTKLTPLSQIAQLRDEIASNEAAAQMDKSTIKQAYKDLKKQLRSCEGDLDHTRSDLAQATARVNDVCAASVHFHRA